MTKGTAGLIVMVAVDIFIDGLVLGIGFAAGAKQGFLLTVALTTEVLFLGLSLTGELSESIRKPANILAAVGGIAILLPLGAAVGIPVSHLPHFWIAAFFSFGLVALLYRSISSRKSCWSRRMRLRNSRGSPACSSWAFC